jgi:glucose/mannose-6-phosphate isomerase
MMIDLDDHEAFKALDPGDMLGQVDGLPQQLVDAYEWGQRLPLPGFQPVQQVLIAGMGGSALGGELLAVHAAPLCRLPITVHRDYGLPAWASGPQTLVIATSYSGNTEEAVDAFAQARARGCQVLAFSMGGRLAEAARAAGAPLWTFSHRGQPRGAVGWLFAPLLALFTRLGLLPDPEPELRSAVKSMQAQQASLRAEVPVAHNPAKRLAGQLCGRLVLIMTAGAMAPVARRWKAQINETAKTWAQVDILPEADHNTLEGLVYPPDALERTMTLFLGAASDHPRNRQRIELTRKAFMCAGLNTDIITAQGQTPLANCWTCINLGDYTAFYLAMLNGEDPSQVSAIASLKTEMKDVHWDG